MAAARREEGDLILISSPMHEEGRIPGEQRERSGEVYDEDVEPGTVGVGWEASTRTWMQRRSETTMARGKAARAKAL